MDRSESCKDATKIDVFGARAVRFPKLFSMRVSQVRAITWSMLTTSLLKPESRAEDGDIDAVVDICDDS